MNCQRRTILFGTLALPFIPLAARIAPDTASAATRAEQLVLVCQNDLPESERFVRSWNSRYACAIDFQGDIEVLLYERLVPMWRRQGVTALAGLTTVSTLFCVSQLAADYGLRLLHREISELSSIDWPSHSARVVEQAMAGIAERRELALFDVLPRSKLALASWLLVPRSWRSKKGGGA